MKANSYANGVVYFVIDGSLYATPFVEEAQELLKECGFDNSKGMWVSFDVNIDFLGRLSSESLEELALNYYYPQSRYLAAAEGVFRYYGEIKRLPTYRRWKDLVERSEALGRDKNGRLRSLDDVIRDDFLAILGIEDDVVTDEMIDEAMKDFNIRLANYLELDIDLKNYRERSK